MSQEFRYLFGCLQNGVNYGRFLSLQIWFEILHWQFIYNRQITMLTIEQPNKSITNKFKRELKTQDFVLLSQENKQYKQIIKLMQDKENILANKISELQKTLVKLQNEKDQYKTICNDYIFKITNYEHIKDQLIQQYRVLKKQIENNFTQIATKDVQLLQVRKFNEKLQQNVVELQQNAKTDRLVIDQLRQYIGKLEKDIIDKKIKIFSHMVDYQPNQQKSAKKQNINYRSNIKNSKNSSKTSSVYYGGSKTNSNINSISFSFASNQSVPLRKETLPKHNKSIYV